MLVELPGAVGWATASPPPLSSAMGLLTDTPSVPSGTMMRVSLPSSTASTSIVALSVSISAITSPALTSSPSCLSQRASLPSVMVGERAGIRIWVPMSARPLLDQHVGPQLLLVRLGAGLGEIGGFLHGRLDLVVNLLDLRLVRAAFEQHRLALLDGVGLLPHLLHLLPLPVLGRIGH